MSELGILLGKADFSRGTDLKERLRNQLFGAKVVQFPGKRIALCEEELEMVNAAGDSLATIGLHSAEEQN